MSATSDAALALAQPRETQAAVAVADGRVVELDDIFSGAPLMRLVEDGPGVWDAVRAAVADRPRGALLAETPLAAPLRRPPKIVCVGLNYRDHAEEVGLDLPERPLLFAKLPTTVIGPGEPIRWDAELTTQVDWEGELAVVIGAPLRRARVEDALAAVFGFTAANDVTARDLQFGDGRWLRGKSLDGFCPLGPVIVPPVALGDASDVAVRTRVNGDVVQDSTTAELVFGVAEILAFASQAFTLEPGDLVLTGTPPGVGMSMTPPRFLAPGDEVAVEVSGVGVLANPVGPHLPPLTAS